MPTVALADVAPFRFAEIEKIRPMIGKIIRIPFIAIITQTLIGIRKTIISLAKEWQMGAKG